MATKRRSSHDTILAALRERGLRYPGAHLKSPWPGHLDLAVKDKTFAYLSVEGEPVSIGCKLPSSGAVALLLPFCEPTPYGLGKSGWVTARFAEGDELPVEMLEAWIDESYRAQAPKKLVAQLDAPADTPTPAVRKARTAAKAKAVTTARTTAKTQAASRARAKRT